MAKPKVEKADQPMVRQMFSTQEKPTRKGPDREEIERRAYELYLARGGAEGDAVEDWFQAERELQARQPER